MMDCIFLTCSYVIRITAESIVTWNKSKLLMEIEKQRVGNPRGCLICNEWLQCVSELYSSHHRDSDVK